MMIEVKDLSFSYGKIQALRNISFSVEEGSITALIGANVDEMYRRFAEAAEWQYYI